MQRSLCKATATCFRRNPTRQKLMSLLATDEDDTLPAEPAESGPAYYYSQPGRPALGPCKMAQLRVLWISGHISPTTSIWREGLSAWSPVSQLPEVFAELSKLSQPPADDLWYYLDAESRQRGGVTPAQIGLLLRRGEVDGLTHVWRNGMAAWVELSSVAELREQLQRDDDDDDDDDDERAREAAMLQARQEAYDPDAEAFMPGAAAARRAAAAATASSSASAAASAVDSATAPAAGGSEAAAADGSGGGADAAKPKRARKNSANRFVSKAGCNVYVNGLPPDVSDAEVAECFKVAGVLKADPVSGAPRIKLYRHADGSLKGDGLVGFLKVERPFCPLQ